MEMFKPQMKLCFHFKKKTFSIVFVSFPHPSQIICLSSQSYQISNIFEFFKRNYRTCTQCSVISTSFPLKYVLHFQDSLLKEYLFRKDISINHKFLTIIWQLWSIFPKDERQDKFIYIFISCLSCPWHK